MLILHLKRRRAKVQNDAKKAQKVYAEHVLLNKNLRRTTTPPTRHNTPQVFVSLPPGCVRGGLRRRLRPPEAGQRRRPRARATARPCISSRAARTTCTAFRNLLLLGWFVVPRRYVAFTPSTRVVSRGGRGWFLWILGPFGPRRGRRGGSERQRSRRWRLHDPTRVERVPRRSAGRPIAARRR